MHKSKFLKVLSSILTFSALLAPPLAFSADSSAISCKGRAMPEARKSLNEPLDSDALLDAAMKGKKFDFNPGASLVSLESNLVQYYGLKESLRAIPDDEGRKAIGRVATLIENNYVIAAKMALGASALRGLIPQPFLVPLSRYVGTMTEPYHEAADLIDVQKKSIEGQKILEKMTPKPRAFARWAVFGFAWDDRVAIDASLAGYCTSSPSAADQRMLEQAVDVARLDRGKRYEEPGAHTGGILIAPPKK